MASIVYSYIDPLGGGNYLTLADWWTDKKGNIVSRDTIEVARLRGSAQHTVGLQMLAADATVDAEHYFQIEAEPGWDHPGVFDRTKSYLSSALDIQVGFTRIGPGICMYLFNAGGSAIHIRNIATDAPVIVDRMIVRQYNDNAIVIVEDSPGATGHCVKNCVFLTATALMTGVWAKTGTKVTVYNCSITMDGDCLHADAGSTIVSRNNYLSPGLLTGTCYNGTGTFVGRDTDMTANAEAIDPARRNVFHNAINFYFPNSGSPGWHEGQTGIEDMHLPPGSALIGQGADLSAVTPSTFIPDVGIDSQARTTWDVGADEYTVPTVISSHIGDGKPYTTFADWVTARKGNLATRDTKEMLYIHGTITEQLLLNEADWGCNSKNYIEVLPEPGEECSYFRTDRARIKAPPGCGDHAPVIVCKAGGTRIGGGLVIDSDSATGGYSNLVGIEYSGESPAPMIFDGLIWRVTAQSGSWAPVCFYATAGLINYNKQVDLNYISPYTHIRNCVMLARSGQYTMLLYQGLFLKIYNNVGVTPLASGGPVVFYGCGTIEENNYWATRNAVYGAGWSGTKGTHTATSDTEAVTPALQNILFDASNFVDVTLNAEDTHLKIGSALLSKGATTDEVTTDLDGTSRVGLIYDIGADQFDQVPVCWNYTARYKNSNRLFKASGRGSFPRKLNIPGNIDPSTGRMIDDGQLINPDEYNVC